MWGWPCFQKSATLPTPRGCSAPQFGGSLLLLHMNPGQMPPVRCPRSFALPAVKRLLVKCLLRSKAPSRSNTPPVKRPPPIRYLEQQFGVKSSSQ